jgi:hypothetical protein
MVAPALAAAHGIWWLCELRIADCGLRIKDFRLQTSDCGLNSVSILSFRERTVNREVRVGHEQIRNPQSAIRIQLGR